MSTYSNRLQPALQNLLQRVVQFFHPRSSCTTTHISADVQRITLNASCMTICGERTEQLDIFCHVTGFMSDFLIFIDVELIRFFHGALQLFKKIIINSPKITQKTIHRLLFLTVLSARRRMLEHPRGRREGRGHIMSVVLFLRSVNVDGSTCIAKLHTMSHHCGWSCNNVTCF